MQFRHWSHQTFIGLCSGHWLLHDPMCFLPTLENVGIKHLVDIWCSKNLDLSQASLGAKSLIDITKSGDKLTMDYQQVKRTFVKAVAELWSMVAASQAPNANHDPN